VIVCLSWFNGLTRFVRKSRNRWNETFNVFDGRTGPSLVDEIGSEVDATKTALQTNNIICHSNCATWLRVAIVWRLSLGELTARSVLGCRLILHQRLLRDAVHTVIYPWSEWRPRRQAGHLGTSSAAATTRLQYFSDWRNDARRELR